MTDAPDELSPYRVGDHYGIHVYQGDRPVATFFREDEAAAFVAARNAELQSTKGSDRE